MKIEFRNKPVSTRFQFLAKVIVITVTLLIANLIAERFSLGFRVEDPFTAIIAAVVIALLNTFLRPILVLLTLPFTIISLGFFLLLINAFIIYLSGKIVPGFVVESFWPAFWLSLLITFFGYLLELPEKMIRRKQQEEQDTFFDPRNGNDDESFSDYEDVTEEDDKKTPPKLEK